MLVVFKSNALRGCFETFENAKKRWGVAVGQRYIDRINILSACATIGDIGKFPHLKFHPLKGKRSGQYAVSLDGPTRLIFSFTDKARTTIRVEEVSVHYGD